MSSVYDVLKERGFIAQCTYEEDLKKALENEKVTFYVGFDPTADSLHIGHYIPIMAMAIQSRDTARTLRQTAITCSCGAPQAVKAHWREGNS